MITVKKKRSLDDFGIKRKRSLENSDEILTFDQTPQGS